MWNIPWLYTLLHSPQKYPFIARTMFICIPTKDLSSRGRKFCLLTNANQAYTIRNVVNLDVSLMPMHPYVIVVTHSIYEKLLCNLNCSLYCFSTTQIVIILYMVYKYVNSSCWYTNRHLIAYKGDYSIFNDTLAPLHNTTSSPHIWLKLYHLLYKLL